MYTYPALNKNYSLKNIYDYLGNSSPTSELDSKKVIGLCSLSEPYAEHLTYFDGEISRKSEKLFSEAKTASVAGVLVNKKLDFNISDSPYLIYSENPRKDFFSLFELFYSQPKIASGMIHPTAIIPTSSTINHPVDIGAYAVIGENVVIEQGSIIYPHVVIYDFVKIGKNCQIHAHATIREGTSIGDHCIIQNGSVIGGDGFGYVFDPEIGLKGVPQVGTVILRDRVEVGSATTIDRATIGTTVVSEGTKIDNLVQLGHNVKVGKHSIICAQAGVAGSTIIGDQVTLGGKAGVADHLTLANGVRIGASSSAISSIYESGDYQGMPAIPSREWRRSQVVISKLTASFKQLSKILKDTKE